MEGLSNCKFPQHEGSDYVHWRKREFNKQADHIANLALQHNSPANVVFLEAWKQAIDESHHIIIFADGGYWASLDRAAGAWIAYGLNPNGSAVLLAFQATVLDALKTSFAAEVIAIASAFDFLSQNFLA